MRPAGEKGKGWRGRAARRGASSCARARRSAESRGAPAAAARVAGRATRDVGIGGGGIYTGDGYVPLLMVKTAERIYLSPFTKDIRAGFTIHSLLFFSHLINQAYALACPPPFSLAPRLSAARENIVTDGAGGGGGGAAVVPAGGGGVQLLECTKPVGVDICNHIINSPEAKLRERVVPL